MGREDQVGGLRGMEGVMEKEAMSGGEGWKGGWRREWRKREAVRIRLDLNLRASEAAIGIFWRN